MSEMYKPLNLMPGTAYRIYDYTKNHIVDGIFLWKEKGLYQFGYYDEVYNKYAVRNVFAHSINDKQIIIKSLVEGEDMLN